ncbi:MAG: DEAD/DEAH box helicase [Patescibacteria group bacterium]|jgi:ATP-dependent RNA helicase RhlE
MTPVHKVAPSFNNLGLAQSLLAILADNKFTNPTPIQHQSIPAILEGKDVIGIAQTGTGKTLAFGLPILQRLAKSKGQALVLVPTRELALQVDEVLQKVGRSLGLKTAVIIGGEPSGRQIAQLRRNPQIVVATPGRLIDHMQQRTYSLEKIQILVLDEADRMLDIGFLPQLKQILAAAPQERQTLMFSATIAKAISELAARHMKMPFRIEVAPSGQTAANIEQEVFVIRKEDKMRLLEKTLTDHDGTVLVFSRTKHGARKIAAGICSMDRKAIEIHSNRSLAQRREAMDGFKSGKYQVLVATDIAARGIDVKDISLVINFDLPDNLDDYVHRIGRTGRAGKFGKAVSFATPEQRSDIKQIERLIRKTLPILTTPTLPPHRVGAAMPEDRERRFGSGGFNRNRQRPSGDRNSYRGSSKSPYHGTFRTPSRSASAGEGRLSGKSGRSQRHSFDYAPRRVSRRDYRGQR